MPVRRDYKCEVGPHYIERVTPMQGYPRAIPCEEHRTSAHVVLGKNVYMWVDNVDRIDYSVTVGRNFTNRRERDEYLRVNGMKIMEPCEYRKMVDAHEEQLDVRRQVEARGEDYGRYLQEQQEKARDAQDRHLSELGVSVGAMSSQEAEAAMDGGAGCSMDEGMQMCSTESSVRNADAYRAEMPTRFSPEGTNWDTIATGV